MTSRDFAFWLQGFLEIRGLGPMTDAQSRLKNRVSAHERDELFMMPVADLSAAESELYGAIRGTQFRRAEERSERRRARGRA